MQVQTRTLVKRDNKKHQRYITMQLQTQTKNSSQLPSAAKICEFLAIRGGESSQIMVNTFLNRICLETVD